MNMKKLAWILAGTSAVSGAVLGLAACSGDDTKPLPAKDSGVDSTTGDAGKDTSPPVDGSKPDAIGPDAASCFSKLRPAPDAGPFCYFIPKANDGGMGVNCATGETCCYGATKGPDAGFDDSVCVSGGAASCPAPTLPPPADSFECAEADDCANGQKCCIVPMTVDGGSATLSTGTDKFTCTYLKGEKGTRCKAACDTGDWQGCQSDGECGGKTCVLINVGAGDRLQMGYCK